jgi:hypothetical protein
MLKKDAEMAVNINNGMLKFLDHKDVLALA